jgi:hypothetical protein
MEYSSKSSIPHTRLPSFATIASNTTRTGVAHCDEKKTAQESCHKCLPKASLLLLLIAYVEGIKLYISQVCKASEA